MAQVLRSSPISIAVAGTPAPASFTAPYPLPAPGTKVAIPVQGRNVANAVKPAPHDNESWQYALFQSYGGGSFSADYSAAGAYVLAGMGGHGAPPCFGAAIFDFSTGRWSYLPNANGYNEARTSDVARNETNGWPYLEMSGVTGGHLPSPSHHYTLQVSPPRSVIGGSRGSVLVTLGAAKTRDGWDSPQSHKMDLATGLWTRASSNLLTAVTKRNPYTDGSAAYDPVTRRVYVTLTFNFPAEDRLAYLDLNDGQWKLTGAFRPAATSSASLSIWVDERRRLLLYLVKNGELWAVDLDNIPAGPARLNTRGMVPEAYSRWHEYPRDDGGDGAFYTFSGRGPAYTGATPPLATSQALLKLTPPADDPLKGVWQFSEAPIAGGITAQYLTDSRGGAGHGSRFFYVPALRCFAWIPNGSGPVELIKP